METTNCEDLLPSFQEAEQHCDVFHVLPTSTLLLIQSQLPRIQFTTHAPPKTMYDRNLIRMKLIILISITPALAFVLQPIGGPKVVANLNAVAGDSERSYVNLNRREAISDALKTAAIITGASAVAKSKPLVALADDSVGTALKVPKVPLGKSSLQVSRTIQGYWQLAGGHGKYNQDEAVKNMKAHYDAGITTLDTADIYGPSEQIIGRFLKDKPEGAVACTKFCCFKFLDEIDRTEVKTRIQKACERLQVDSLPLVQFFWSNYSIKKYVDVALMLTELKEEGLIGEIGATNFDLKRLKEMKSAGVPLVSHQVQLSCLDQRLVFQVE